MNSLVLFIAIFKVLCGVGFLTFCILLFVVFIGFMDDFSVKSLRLLLIAACVNLGVGATSYIGSRILLFRYDEKVATYQLLGEDYIKTKGIITLIEKLECMDKEGLIEVLDAATGNKKDG